MAAVEYMDTAFCVDALEEALERYGAPGTFKYRPTQPVH